MKKVIALLLAAVMMLGLFAGCGNTASDNNQPTTGNTSNDNGNTGNDGVEQIALKVWVPEEEIEITKELCAAFDEAHPEYEITSTSLLLVSTSPRACCPTTPNWLLTLCSFPPAVSPSSTRLACCCPSPLTWMP